MQKLMNNVCEHFRYNFLTHLILEQVLAWCTPKLLDGLNYESKDEDNRKRRSWGVVLGSQHFEGKGAC
jgi:hypothetical protein